MEQDIIINYTDKDNESSSKSENGWVDDFSRFLKIMLTQVLGREPSIIMKTEGSALSVAELKNTGVLISILSPQFMNSGQCLDAIEEFHKVSTSSVPRTFKVLKTEVGYDDQPAKLKDAIAYELYDLDYESGSAIVFNDYFGPAAENVYWMKMVDLAYDVHESLLMLQDADAKDGVTPLYKRDTIFLAETGQDLNVQRNVIRRELQRHGFRVLPDHTLPRDVAAAEIEIKKELAESVMSVHLIGSSYGEIPSGGDKSIVDIENRLAAEKVKDNPDGRKLQRLIWINPNQENSSDQQKSFIENIQRDLAALEAAEIFQIPLEDFKNTLREELFDNTNGSDGQSFEIKVDDKKTNAYLIYDKIDKEEATAVGKELTKAGLNVLHSEFDGNVLELRKMHQEKLKHLDVGIVFKGKVNDNWVRMKILDLLKAPGLGRNKPILGKAVIGGIGAELASEKYKDLDLEIMSTDRKETLSAQIENFIKGLNKPI